ncbi:hypothetical protein FACS1894152_1540 [Bacilli bacterium]|nr:hypothetical protein FACS1894152_1540 [Bacilli bacterium]
MSYEIGVDGIQIPTLSEIIERKTQQFREIYGEDINIEQNSPDGQFINIISQAEADQAEHCVEVYNSFDPDNAVGRELDRCVAYKGLKRKGATRTQLVITITTDRACIVKAGFMVGDEIGNNFTLMQDFVCGVAGTYDRLFQSVDSGEMTVGLYTVVNIVTPMLGVTGVINSYLPFQNGVNEEDDLTLRARFKKSVAITGTGSVDILYSVLNNFDDVIDCHVENNTSWEVSPQGTPPKSIWVTINGGTEEEIANAIYSCIPPGCGMRGQTEFDIITSQNEVQPILFDYVEPEPVYIRFNVYGKTPGTLIDQNQIKTDLINGIIVETTFLYESRYRNNYLKVNSKHLLKRVFCVLYSILLVYILPAR